MTLFFPTARNIASHSNAPPKIRAKYHNGKYIWGNLLEDITKPDICEHFDLNSTSYLRDTCNTDFPINNKIGKLKGFTFIRAPAHITDEIIKLYGIAYHDNELRVQDATSTRKRTNKTLQINLEGLT